MKDGIIDGSGTYKSLSQSSVYEGEFRNGKRDGPGKFYIQGGTYEYEGNFVDGKPEVVAN
jgi:hypothetical protein